VSEPKLRLNLIQRAMQRATLPRQTVPVDDGPVKGIQERPQIAFSEQKWANGAASMPHVEPAQIARIAQPVHLDYAKLRASRIVTPDNKRSGAYNEFRSLKRKLLPMTLDPETGIVARNVVMVTSALPREGKTFTAMGFAISLAAESNLNVILVDGDVVRGSIADYFHGEDQDGLVELLTGKRQRIDDLLHPCSDLPRLHVLFAGKRHEAAPEMLASSRMGEICAALSKHFQQSIVLFDAPPVLAASEPAAMAAHAHHLIMLVASDRSARHQVESALAEVSCCPSISLLFNKSPRWQRPLSDPYYYYGDGDKSQEA
jgi:protein-tyrosine kinase